MKFVDLVGKLPVHPKKRPSRRKLSDIKKLVLHCTDWDISPEALAQYDIGPNHISSTGCPTITYAFLVQKDGTVVQTAELETVTWHAAGHNSSSVGLSLVYKTDARFESGKAVERPAPNFLPTGEQLMAAVEVLGNLCLKLGLTPDKVVGHRECEGTGFTLEKGHKRLKKTCPGMAVNLDDLREDVAMAMQQVLKAKELYTGKIDGDFGPRSIAALAEFRKRGF